LDFLSACARVFLSRRRSIPSCPQTPVYFGAGFCHPSFAASCRLDTYRCSLKFHLLTAAFHEELVEYFRYVPDQVALVAIDPLWLSISECEPQKTVGIEDECISGSPDSEQREVRNPSKKQPRSLGFLTAQQQILTLDDHPAWLSGRLKAVAAVLKNLVIFLGNAEAEGQIDASLAAAVASASGLPLLEWLNAHRSQFIPKLVQQSVADGSRTGAEEEAAASAASKPIADDGIKFGRRAEDNQTVRAASRSIRPRSTGS